MAALPRVGVSSCLLGEQVRYDGGHRRQPELIEAFAGQVEWVPVCPEVAIGLGVPRETIQIEPADGGLRLMTAQTRCDLTAAMRSWAGGRVAELAAQGICGYVLKARSPSCGVESAPIAGGGVTSGLFAAELIRLLPQLPVAEESGLATPGGRTQFLDRVRSYCNQGKY